ncbi:MAG TPA: hypothetical protein VJV23_07965 [Candidatus Polarisedimenticolia bacterium]|nr:hypothetical protein [Candidatus Polarisedimenticolia bacterium]
MIGLVGTFVWLRWRLLVRSLRGGRRRDGLERLSRILSVAAPLVILAFFLLFAVGFAVLAFGAGRLLAAGDAPRKLMAAVRLVLLAATGVVVLLPLGRSMQGGTEGTARLLLLPIPRSLLHAVDTAAGLLDPWILFIAPALAALPAGMAVGGGGAAGAAALLAGAALLLVLACCSALTAFSVQWLLRDRRRGETAMLVFMLLVTMAGFGVSLAVPRDDGEARAFSARLADLPAWTAVLPSELYARCVTAALQGRGAQAALCVAALLVEAGAVFWLSSRVHAMLLAGGGGSSWKRRTRRRGEREMRWPGVSAPVAAVARAQAVTALRTVRGRLAILLSGPFTLLMGLTLRGLVAEHPLGGAVVEGPSLLAMGMMLTLMSLQPILVNQFASDRSGLTLQMLAPVADGELLAGKALGGLLLCGSSWVLCLAAALGIAPNGHPALWAATLLAGAGTAAALVPAAALLSILFPKKADLSRMGKEGNPHAAAALLGTLATLAAVLPGSAVVLLAGHLFGMPVLAALMAGVWAAAAGAGAVLALRGLAPLLAERRENLSLAARGG